MKFHLVKAFLLILIATNLFSCLSLAKISDFPNSSEEIDFEHYSKLNQNSDTEKERQRTNETTNEHYLSTDRAIKKDSLIHVIIQALNAEGYKRVLKNDSANNCIVAKRGLKANEWSSLTGVYFKINEQNNNTQIYINTKITQDYTGGWKENRAEKIGNILKKLINNNIK